jgi:hypothetical protein
VRPFGTKPRDAVGDVRKVSTVFHVETGAETSRPRGRGAEGPSNVSCVDRDVRQRGHRPVARRCEVTFGVLAQDGHELANGPLPEFAGGLDRVLVETTREYRTHDEARHAHTKWGHQVPGHVVDGPRGAKGRYRELLLFQPVEQLGRTSPPGGDEAEHLTCGLTAVGGVAPTVRTIFQRPTFRRRR